MGLRLPEMKQVFGQLLRSRRSAGRQDRAINRSFNDLLLKNGRRSSTRPAASPPARWPRGSAKRSDLAGGAVAID